MDSTKSGLSESEITQSLDSVQAWVESHSYRGYEPFDGLSSCARPLACGNLFAERLLMQLNRQSPFNLRPLLGIAPQDSTKGRGYMAYGYLLRFKATGIHEHLDKAIRCLEWLDQHKVPRFAHHSWSNHFDFVGRGGGYTRNDPIIVWTCLIGQAYLEAWEITAQERWLRIADSVCAWIMALPREHTPNGDCLSYLPNVQSSIHNSNMLGGAMLARTAKHTGNSEYLKVARSAMEYSCSRQRPDGSWWYAESSSHHWIDNFHTGYNLESLKCYIDSTGDKSYAGNLRSGLEFFKRHFFEPDGCPRYYHSRRYPVDIQCAAQAIDTLALFALEDPTCPELSRRVTRWTIDNMQDPDGHFYYRRYPLLTARTPMLHWGQATMFKALAHSLYRMGNNGQPTPRANERNPR